MPEVVVLIVDVDHEYMTKATSYKLSNLIFFILRSANEWQNVLVMEDVVFHVIIFAGGEEWREHRPLISLKVHDTGRWPSYGALQPLRRWISQRVPASKFLHPSAVLIVGHDKGQVQVAHLLLDEFQNCPRLFGKHQDRKYLPERPDIRLAVQAYLRLTADILSVLHHLLNGMSGR
jgi:hypothetical protein